MAQQRFLFDDFELDRRAYELRHRGGIVGLQRIPLELLFLLVENHGQLVTREEIIERIWGKETFFDAPAAINTAIRKIRRALGDDPDTSRFIGTVPSKGYRFAASVVVLDGVEQTASDSNSSHGELTTTEAAREAEWSPGFQSKPSGSAEGGLSRQKQRRTLLTTAGFALIAGIVLTARHLWFRPQAPSASIQATAPPLPDIPSIAVLPFANLSRDPDQEYFSDGITDDLITDLSRLPNLFVIARTSSFAYKGKAETVQQVGRELGVKYVLEGSVRRAGDQVRINVQLVDAITGNQVWAQRHDRQLRDIFKLQDEIVRGLITTLGLQLALLEKGVVVPQRTKNLDAYDFYLRGFQLFAEGTPAAFASSINMFEKAVAIDPDYADAYAALGFARWLDYGWQWDTHPRALDRAEELARRAISLDDSNSLAYSVLGWVAAWKGRSNEAIANGRRAAALDPNSWFACLTLSGLSIVSGKPHEALAYAQKAMRLDPKHPERYSLYVGEAYISMGRYQEALDALKTAPVTNPSVHLSLIYTYTELGREQDARAEAAELLRLVPRFSVEEFRKTTPVWDPPFQQHYLDDLRKAGLK
jgi:TolB-like protein/DNA-binding winged helix-turn-helix (wHTH) protein